MKTLIKTMVFLLAVTLATTARAGGQRTFTVNGVSFTMVAVDGGTFTMGATAEQGSDYNSDERPTHQVTLSDFMIGQTEVTEALWTAVMGSYPSYYKKGDNYPVEYVSWDDCQTFITKLNQLTGATFRLPTEAEWEFAARGGNQSKGYKYAGSNNLYDVGWFDNNSGGAKHSVATKAANELGIYDMSGNVWEWCQDYYGNYSSESQTNPTGPSSGATHLFRGGSWSNITSDCRVSLRHYQNANNKFNDIGLRLALDNNLATYTVNGVSFTMVAVDGGTFTMGATSEQGNDYNSDERPTHQVTLSDFMIGQTEVTEALWTAVMGSYPSYYKKGDNYPVEYVSWDDCQTFITKLNQLTGATFRLPTEAEWEFAARGGNQSKGYKYAGSNNLYDVGWFDNNSGGAKHSVATKAANELGIYDMSGNVWEWCQDYYGNYTSESQTNPTGPLSGATHLFRGGSWSNITSDCRVSLRHYQNANNKFNDIGLRLALDNNLVTYTVNGVSFTMVAVEGGTFTMGATSEQGSDALDSEFPTHQVTLGNFMIGQTEVTEGLWKAVMGSNPSENKRGDNYPVEYVSWDACQQFVAKLNEMTGQNFRLPTEAEWEFAARGGNKSKGYKYAGSDNIADVAWYSSSAKHEVSTKAPNELGLYDMSGNVWELCHDWYDSFSNDAQTNPTGPTSGSYHVARGGGWWNEAWLCRVSFRSKNTPSDKYNDLGLRLAMSTSSNPTNQSSGVTTVGEGGVLSEGMPICNWWMNTYQGCELLYLNNELGLRRGDVITALSYHCVKGNAPGGTFNVRIKNTTLQRVPAEAEGVCDKSLLQINCDDKVYGTVTLGAYSQGDWITFPLSEPFVYDGNNIIIDIRNTKPGSRTGWCYFDGWESDDLRDFCWSGATDEAISGSYSEFYAFRYLPQMRVSYTTTGEEIVQATSLSLDESEVTLSVNETVRLAATIEPDNVTNSTLSWLSDNPSVATVDAEGNVKALKSGIATITAKTTDGSNLSASCRITVVKDYLISATMLQHLRGEPEAVVELPISLDNRTAVAQMQFDITLPEAVTIAGDYDAATGLTFYDDCIRLDDARKSRSHYGEVTKLSGANTYRVLIGTTQGNTTLKGNHGVVAYLTLHLAQYHDAGDFDVLFSNIIMTGTDQADQHTADNATSLVRLEYMLGDANADVAVDVADYQVTARHILTLSTPRFYADAANVYAADGTINVSDLQGIVNIISGINSTTIKHAPKHQASAGLALVPRMTGDGAVAIALTGGVPIGALQMDLTLPQGATLVGAEMASGGSHQVDYATLPDGKVRLLVSSPDGATLETGDEPFLMLTLDGAHGGIAMLGEAIAVETDLTTYRLNNATFELTLTGIDSPMAELASIRVVNNVLVIDSPTDGTAQLVRVNGVATPMDVKAGRNEFVLGQGVYAVRLGGAAAKIIIR